MDPGLAKGDTRPCKEFLWACYAAATGYLSPEPLPGENVTPAELRLSNSFKEQPLFETRTARI